MLAQTAPLPGDCQGRSGADAFKHSQTVTVINSWILVARDSEEERDKVPLEGTMAQTQSAQDFCPSVGERRAPLCLSSAADWSSCRFCSSSSRCLAHCR